MQTNPLQPSGFSKFVNLIKDAFNQINTQYTKTLNIFLKKDSDSQRPTPTNLDNKVIVQKKSLTIYQVLMMLI